MKFFYKFIIFGLLTAIIIIITGNQGIIQLKKVELEISKMEYASNHSLNLNIPLLKTSLEIEKLISRIKENFDKIDSSSNSEEIDASFSEINKLEDSIKEESAYIKDFEEVKRIDKNLDYFEKLLKKYVYLKNEMFKYENKNKAFLDEYYDLLAEQENVKKDFDNLLEENLRKNTRKSLKRSMFFILKYINSSMKTEDKDISEVQAVNFLRYSDFVGKYFKDKSIQNNGHIFLLGKDDRVIYHEFLEKNYEVREDQLYFPKPDKEKKKAVIVIEEIYDLGIKIGGVLYTEELPEIKKIENYKSFYQEVLNYEGNFLKYGKDDFTNLKFSKDILEETLFNLSEESEELKKGKERLDDVIVKRSKIFDKLFLSTINLRTHKLELEELKTDLKLRLKVVDQSLKSIQNKADKVIKEANRHYYSLKEDIKDVIEKSRNTQSIIIVLGIMAAGIFTFSLFNDIHINLADVKEFLRKLNQGNYHERMEIKTKGEFKTLYIELNKMAEELEQNQKEINELTQNLELQVEVRTESLLKANKKIKEQEQKLVEEAYNRGLVEVSSGIVHNIGNIINVLYLNLSEIMMNFPKTRNKGLVFIKDILYPSLLSIENKDKNLEKIVEVMPELSELMEDMDKKLKSNLELSMKKIEHIRSIIRLQQNFIGSLGTENYYDMNEVLNEIADIYMVSIERRNINFIKNYSKVPKLVFDKNQIIQVFGNIIKNAYEAIELAGKESGEVKVSTNYDKEQEKIVIQVKDNGEGIKEENIAKIFDFGFSSKREIKKGSGFGLHHSRDIIRKYKGDIKVESVEGKGTVFIVSLPIIKTE